MIDGRVILFSKESSNSDVWSDSFNVASILDAHAQKISM